ncbi:hypothetical protein MBANPS3_012045 [Mucor bainieri]
MLPPEELSNRIRQDQPTDTTTEILRKIDAAHYVGRVLMDQTIIDHEDTAEGRAVTNVLEVFLLTWSLRIQIVQRMLQSRSTKQQQQE